MAVIAALVFVGVLVAGKVNRYWERKDRNRRY